jgi:hypothetical protein
MVAQSNGLRPSRVTSYLFFRAAVSTFGLRRWFLAAPPHRRLSGKPSGRMFRMRPTSSGRAMGETPRSGDIREHSRSRDHPLLRGRPGTVPDARTTTRPGKRRVASRRDARHQVQHLRRRSRRHTSDHPRQRARSATGASRCRHISLTRTYLRRSAQGTFSRTGACEGGTAIRRRTSSGGTARDCRGMTSSVRIVRSPRRRSP